MNILTNIINNWFLLEPWEQWVIALSLITGATGMIGWLFWYRMYQKLTNELQERDK
jgi:hypothetical protein